MSDTNDFGNFMAGFVIGGLVGAAVALLTAPQSGEETRTIIREKSIELKDKAVETGQEARVRAEKAFEEARVRADHSLEELRVRADELARVTRERAAELQQRFGAQKPVEAVSIPPEAADAAAPAEA
jgi:gas vesicle protein